MFSNINNRKSRGTTFLQGQNLFQKGWIGEASKSSSCFTDIDLTEKEWVEYDEKSQESVGIYEFESKFVPNK